MLWWGMEAAKAAKIAVWWDMKDCPIPEGYDARRVRPSLEAAFKKRGYSGPVSITAYGDQTQTPVDLLRGLNSTGVTVSHTKSDCTYSLMYEDMVEWRDHNPPPATMMIISDHVEDAFSWDLVRLQQRTQYNLFLAYSVESQFMSVLLTSAEWLWKKLLGSADNKKRSAPLVQDKCTETADELSAAMFYCKSCNYDAKRLKKFRKHLSSYNHAREEGTNVDLLYPSVEFVTTTWARNYAATPEYATAKILVWWDMFDCPIPEGYDARRVRPSLEAAFKNLGYSGPVSITAFGDLKHIPDHLLRGLSSTGVDVAHSVVEGMYVRMFRDLLECENCNPPPATIMVISDHAESISSTCLVHLVQEHKYNLFRAYSFRPYEPSVLLTSAEWLWESLLAVPVTRRHVLQKCSRNESDRGESTGMFYCKLCFCDCKSLDNFRTHLSSKEHARKENGILLFVESNEQEHKLIRLTQYDREHREQWREVENSPKSKRMRKA